MFLRGCGRLPKVESCALAWTLHSSPWLYDSQCCRRNIAPAKSFSDQCRCLSATISSNASHDFLNIYKDSFRAHLTSSFSFLDPSENQKWIGKVVEVHGFLGKRKDLSDKLSFVPLITSGSTNDRIPIQVVSRIKNAKLTTGAELQDALQSLGTSQDVHQKLKNIKPHSAVSISAFLRKKREPKGKDGQLKGLEDFSKGNLELVLRDITCLATFPEDIIVSDDVQFGPENRHLQIRFDSALMDRLKFRSRVLKSCRLALHDFQEIETPILFKSTPEGAREFLIPTRRPGYAYALPQSPQQYKQILMASGIDKYYQIAKCFRDEDLRADRQPEFTQIDLEMAFSDGEKVMEKVEYLTGILSQMLPRHHLAMKLPEPPFLRMTYHEAMRKYGTDKPDLRIPDPIYPVDTIMSKDLIGMLTSLSDPVVESWKIRLNDDSSVVRSFVQQFMDSPEAMAFRQNPDGAPGIFIYDSRKPLEGLQAFGHEGAKALKALYADLNKSKDDTVGTSVSDSVSDGPVMEPFNDGDLIVIQARPRVRLSGGSTTLGRLRNAIYNAAVSKGLVAQDPSGRFLWVTDFPLFTPNNETDPGQGGSAGFSSTHHPFTAPKTIKDVDLLLTDPLAAIADHYDLVVNGVELGGGSRRIHNSEMQQFVMRDILKMSEDRLKDFSHLFEVLRAGCPPHAGIALGLDRLIAVLLGRDSVRDVIAFPKSGKGEDLLVKSPSLMTKDQQETYHIKVVEK